MSKGKTDKSFIRRDYQIRAFEVVVIFEGQNLGVFRNKDAQDLAAEKQLNLVEISPAAKPPICLIVDYGKWLYEKQKRSKKQQKNRPPALKEIQFGPAIDKHDLETKISNIRKFLDSGHSVLVSVSFKARQKAHLDEGQRVLEEVLRATEDVGKADDRPSIQGRSRITVRISPKGK